MDRSHVYADGARAVDRSNKVCSLRCHADSKHPLVLSIDHSSEVMAAAGHRQVCAGWGRRRARRRCDCQCDAVGKQTKPMQALEAVVEQTVVTPILSLAERNCARI